MPVFRILQGNDLERVRKDSKFLREFAGYLDSKSKERVIELEKSNEILKSLVTQKRSGGQRLTQAAALLLLTPDPITDAAAIPVLLAAQVVKMRSKKQSDMQRILEGARKEITTLFSLAEFSSL
jgi:hypothetical protein